MDCKDLPVPALFFCAVKKNRMMFYANQRKGMVCNPAFLMNYIYENFSGAFELVWVSDWPETCGRPAGITVVGKGSFLYYFYFIRTKFFITNDYFDENLIKKKGQIIVCTWHGGGAYKKIGTKALLKTGEKILNSKKSYGRFSFFLSSCQKCTDTFPALLGLSGAEMLNIGSLGNDRFFEGHRKRQERVRKFYNLRKGCRIVLYAPSFWRAESLQESKGAMLETLAGLVCALEKKTGDVWICLVRRHYLDEAGKRKTGRERTEKKGTGNNRTGYEKTDETYQQILNGNLYYEIQDLLLASDVLITDVSSVMWDAMLLYKPVFLLSDRVREYEKKDRGFIVPPEKWPFFFVDRIEEIPEILAEMDREEYILRIKKHLEYMGSFEKGNACGEFMRRVVWEFSGE